MFSNFIPCGVYEATYIFDGIIENESDIQPTTIHGDTGAQSEVVFAFSWLLAIQLMPRIRNFKHLKYYKPVVNDGFEFEHIESIFTNEKIDWALIDDPPSKYRTPTLCSTLELKWCLIPQG